MEREDKETEKTEKNRRRERKRKSSPRRNKLRNQRQRFCVRLKKTDKKKKRNSFNHV